MGGVKKGEKEGLLKTILTNKTLNSKNKTKLEMKRSLIFGTINGWYVNKIHNKIP